MLISNRAIPRVATAGLVLGACGDSHPSPAALASEACAAMVECDYAFPYTSAEQCETAWEAEFIETADYLAETWGAACADAVLDYYACYVSEFRDLCSVPLSKGSCEDSSYRAYEICFL